MKKAVFGIDLGTTNSCIALIKDGKPAELITIDGAKTVPSVVAYDGKNWLVGMAAKNYSRIFPLKSVESIKRKMGYLDYKVNIDGSSLSPIAISAKILNYLKTSAQSALDCEVNDVVITVPAWFTHEQRQATIMAGEQAGLKVIRLINEPTSAAIAYDKEILHEEDREHWLVYDLGGGTFDVSVLSVAKYSKEVLATTGNSYLGGDDFDHRIVQMFKEKIHHDNNFDPSEDPVMMAKLGHIAEESKISLSTNTEVTINEPIKTKNHQTELNYTFKRVEFEEMIEDLIDSTVQKSRQAIEEANISIEDLDRLLLVGGSTRIPCVTDRLCTEFQISPEKYIDPDLCVAVGAAHQAALVQGLSFEQTVVDVCPHSVGLAVMGKEDKLDENPLDLLELQKNHPLTFAPLIRRNTPLPARFLKTFYKAFAEQEKAGITIYQGESSLTPENKFIGEFFVDLQDSTTKEVQVEFAYDLNGMINIGVRERTDSEKVTKYCLDLNSLIDNDGEDQLFIAAADDPDQSSHQQEVTNFLINKVSSLLQESPTDNTEIEAKLEHYKTILTGENHEEIDDLEDYLYDWVDAQQDTLS